MKRAVLPPSLRTATRRAAALAGNGGLARAVAAEARLVRTRRRMEADLDRVAGTGGTLVVGPWTSEIGYELLYWIPFLRRLFAERGLSRDRVTAISRGGVAEWYGDIAAQYVDVLDVVSVECYRSERARHVKAQKQLTVSAFDEQLLAKIAPSADGWLHPLVMTSRLRYAWAGERPVADIAALCRWAPVTLATGRASPWPYVAVKPYFNDVFRDTPAARQFVDHLVGRLREQGDVVLLTTGLGLDEHVDAYAAAPATVGIGTADRNLAEQTHIIAGADAFVGTYGGPSYLAPLLGVRSISFRTRATANPVHLDVARLAAAASGGPAPLVCDVRGAPIEQADRIAAAVARYQEALDRSPSNSANSAGPGSASNATHGSDSSSSASE